MRKRRRSRRGSICLSRSGWTAIVGSSVALGTGLSARPPHRSQPAGLPHWAPASGNDVHVAQGIRMTYASLRQPLLDQPSHAFPGDTAFVASPRQGAVPAMAEFGFDRAQLHLQPAPHRLPKHREAAIAPLLPADVREAEEVEGLRLAPSSASASRSNVLSRLNTRPARTPVNASPVPLRAATHDSGPLWAANPSTCDSFIHNTSPVYPAAIWCTSRS